MLNKFARIELNQELLQASRGDKQSSKDGKDGKEGKDDISAAPDTGGWV
ncbi:hypothetical protein [Candidatus Synchoanobacter obligatus]|uniref:Uncharacterized protein n=1 Tax=Candidatus Synchoanobacter obligatus TaxID=2919597 RepID=A0ABT1L531_9GAMM|nr:hypothetical protein [Candidatus Synchoanobacter obligatus]MCP8352287.1 hypothetical protein [Candidatus Synchoanobacter obligatus]